MDAIQHQEAQAAAPLRQPANASGAKRDSSQLMRDEEGEIKYDAGVWFKGKLSKLTSYYWASTTSSSNAEPKRLPGETILQDIIQKKDDELAELMKEAQKKDGIIQYLKRTIKLDKQHDLEREQRHGTEVAHLQDTMEKYKINLQTSTKCNESLEEKVSELEAQLSKAYSRAMSTWAQDVSRDVPDDVIRGKVGSFFEGDFFSWCADMCATEVDWEKGYKAVLYQSNLVNQGSRYLSAPAYLQFDYSATDGTSTLVLLQAALADALVRTFLSSPYFLVGDGVVLQRIESHFANLSSIETATNWRATTVRNLEKTVSLDPKFFEVQAEHFVQTFGFLLQDLDRSALTDLQALFSSFSAIALKLWQTPTAIQVVAMRDFCDWEVSLNCPYVECEAVVASALGAQLNGRPIGVMMRPCILSCPIPQPGKEVLPVVWSKALAWVSKEKAPSTTGN